MVLAAVGGVLLAIGVLGLLLLHLTDRRNKAIRRVIGGLTIGSCDPANLKGELLQQMTGNTKLMYGTDTFAAAVEDQLAKGALARAMWAARLAVAVEDRREGERLTDLVLRDPRVAAAVEEVRRHPDRWASVMLTPEEAAEVEEAQRLDVRAGPPRLPAKSAEQEDEAPKKAARRPRNDEDY
jgi:hypothetical protein